MPVAEAVYSNFARQLGCTPADLACLRAANASRVLAAEGSVLPERFATRWNPWAPTVDGVELHAEAWELARAGVRAPVPLILGSNRDEFSAVYFGEAPLQLDQHGLEQLVPSLVPLPYGSGEVRAAAATRIDAMVDARVPAAATLPPSALWHLCFPARPATTMNHCCRCRA